MVRRFARGKEMADWDRGAAALGWGEESMSYQNLRGFVQQRKWFWPWRAQTGTMCPDFGFGRKMTLSGQDCSRQARTS